MDIRTRRGHPGRSLLALALPFAILAALVFFAGTGNGWSLRQRLAPRLGLDVALLLGGGQRVGRDAAWQE